MKPTFVYAPRLGPYWIDAAGPRPGLAVTAAVWRNRSAHLVGGTESRLLRELAAAVAVWAAGVAWDVRGEVHMYVPPSGASAAHGLVLLGAGEVEGGWTHETHELLPVVAALFRSAGGVPTTEGALALWRDAARHLPGAEWVQAVTKACGLHAVAGGVEADVHLRPADNGKVEVYVADPGVRVRAPAVWGPPEIYGGILIDDIAA
jgi:hypothetical protein